MKPKTCKNPSCKAKFIPIRPLQQVCGMECAIAYSKQVKAKQERAETKVKKLSAKPLQKWLDEAQVEFNRYIRLRDAHLPCISCGTYQTPQWCAGHYRTRGAASHLRFNEDNVHKQCNHYCNLKRSGNIIAYRQGLIARIGIEMVEALENDNQAKKWTIDEAKQIKAKYRKLANELEKQS